MGEEGGGGGAATSGAQVETSAAHHPRLPRPLARGGAGGQVKGAGEREAAKQAAAPILAWITCTTLHHHYDNMRRGYRFMRTVGSIGCT